MPLIVTPRQLNLRAELYHQIGIMIAAGLSVHNALDHLGRNPPSRDMRPMIDRWLQALNEGATVTESMQRTSKWTPEFDMSLIEAGEKSGRMDACFQLLAVYYRERAQMARQMISDSLYPMCLLNFALILFPFIDWFSDSNWVRFLTRIALFAVPIYGGIFIIVFLCQGRHGEAWRHKVELVLRAVPILGKARKDLAIARLSMALESLLNAGVSIVRGWELAATASGSPALRRTVVSWKDTIENGGTYSQLVSNSREFPELFANLYHTGEISGSLDHTLRRLHDLFQSEGTRKMRALSTWLPKIVYFGIMIYVAYRVVSFYMGYFQQISNAMDMK